MGEWMDGCVDVCVFLGGKVLTISAVLSVESIWYSRRKEKGDRDEEADR